MNKLMKFAFFLMIAAALSGCMGSSNADMKKYIDDTLAKPAGEIAPLPTFKPYKAYNYSNLALRSPFQRPRAANAAEDFGKVVAAPDETRPKEFLEGKPFASLSMVGMLQQDGFIWALINDGSGGIHRVSMGNYMGKNHGKIVQLSTTSLNVVEIVPDGRGGWLERPRTLTLNRKK